MKKIQMILVILFFAVIVLPALFFNRDNDRVLLWEFRTVNTFPEISSFSETDARTKIEGWLGDNIGFKDAATYIHGIIQYKLFDNILNTHILQGKNGQLFYVNGNVKDPQTIPPIEMKMQDNAGYVEMIVSMRDDLSKKGIPFIFVAIPNKEQVYPEYYPEEVKASPKVSLIGIVADELSQVHGVNTVNLQQTFLAVKTEEPLLYRNIMDPSHWNELGAWIGYKEIMKKVRVQVADVQVLDENDVVFKKSIVELDSEGTEYGYWQGKETVYTPEFVSGLNSEELFRSDNRVNFDRREENSDDGETLTMNDLIALGVSRAWHYRNITCENDKTLFVIGDSYAYHFLYKYFAESFRDVYIIQHDELYNKINAIDKIIEKSAPNVVIYEIVDRMYR
jgi:hypothetical protein